MLLQVEAIREKAAKHKGDLFFAGAFRRTSHDIVFVLVEPRRPEYLIHLAVPRLSDEAFQRDVFPRESSGGVSYLVVVVRADFVLAGPDRGNFERRGRLGQDDDSRHREKQDEKQPPHAVENNAGRERQQMKAERERSSA